MNNVNKLFLVLLMIVLIAALIFSSCAKIGEEPTEPETSTAPAAPAAPAAPEKNEIVIGMVRSYSGSWAPWAVFFPGALAVWLDDVNNEGGIYVEEYGKKLPVRIIEYDDKSDIGTCTRLFEKLIVDDKVDFVFPPCGTAFLFATASIADKHNMLFMGAEGSCEELLKEINGLPYFFATLQFASHYQAPVMVDVFQELGVKSAAIVFIADLFGIESAAVSVPLLAGAGIDVKMVKSVPPGIKDVSDIVKEAKALDVDAFLCFCYPDENFLLQRQAREIDFNPPVFLQTCGSGLQTFADSFGADVVEGVMSWGAWSLHSAGGQEYYDKHIAIHGDANTIDFVGSLTYYASLQYWQEAVEKAGTLDQDKIRDIFASGEQFDTVLGPFYFAEDHTVAKECYAGQIGQWHNGVYEVIDPGERRTMEPIFPKPAWPEK